MNLKKKLLVHSILLQPAISLSDFINTPHYEADVFIDPGESYIIFCANRPDGLGEGDPYISFSDTSFKGIR
jgi:hypothetical protein